MVQLKCIFGRFYRLPGARWKVEETPLRESGMCDRHDSLITFIHYYLPIYYKLRM